MMGERDVSGVGSARRRRERRLRAFHRHEAMSVRLALATALHHSAQRVEVPREGVEGVTSDAPRRPKPPPPGKRPGVLLDPEPAQVVDAVTLYVAAPGPSSLPRLAANDALDNATLKFLVARALLDRREQEEERRKREEEVKKRMKVWLEQRTAEGRRELEQRLDSGGASSKRKKKKRRRKRLPKASSSRLRRGARSSVSGCCLKSSRFGSWEMTSGSSPYSVFSWFGSGYSTCVSRRCFWLLFHIFLCEGGPRLQRSILAAACPHGCLQARDAPHLGRYDQKDILAATQRPEMLGIMAVVNQQDSYALFPGCSMYNAGFAGVDAPRAVFLRCPQAPDARHHGRHGPEGQFSVRFLVAFPQVQLMDEVVVPFVCNDICPSPAVHSGGAAGAAHHRGHLHPLRGAEFGSHGPHCLQTMRFHVCSSSTRINMPVVELHRCLGWSRQCSFCGFRSLHCSGQVDDMPADVSFFLAVYTGTRPGVPPPSGRGRGGEDAGSLFPGVLPPN